MKKICCLCNKKHKAKGFCNDHYQNFKTTGSAFGKTGRPRRNNIHHMLNIISKILPDSNGCKIWPMGINSSGYGHFSIKDKSYNVSRLLYYFLCPDTSKDLVVRHKCDNRSCCNIDHLEIGTQKQNMQDASIRNRLRCGRRNNMSKLTEENVLYIRAEYPKKSTWELSKELGINHSNISKAIQGITWKHVAEHKDVASKNPAKGIKHAKCKLSENDVREIRAKYPRKNGLELAIEYGMSHGNIYAIINRRIWKHI